MEIKVYKFENKRIDSMNYMLSLPEGYEKGNKYPMIVALHGAGERGYDSEKIFVHGVAKYIKAGLKLPAIVIAPQCPEDLIWNLLTVELKELIDYVALEYGADEDRISLTGLSMGAFGTWEMGMSYPGFFSALAPICGGGVAWRARLIGKTPVWAFHGDKDNVVDPENSYMMVDSLRSSGGNVKLTIFNNVGHNSWESAYEDTKVIDWLISHNRKENV